MRSSTRRALALSVVATILAVTAGIVGAKVGGAGFSWSYSLAPAALPSVVWGLMDGARRLWFAIIPKQVSIGRPWGEIYRRSDTHPSTSILNFRIDEDSQQE